MTIPASDGPIEHDDSIERDGPVVSDLELRIKAGDREALAMFIDTHRDLLLSFIRSITGDHLLARMELDDLFQEVAATALSSLETAPLDQYQPWQWLQQLARRRVVDAHRYHFDAQRRDAGRQQSIHGHDDSGASVQGLEQLLAVSMTSASEAISRDVRLTRLQLAIEELSPEQRTAVRLRYADGLPTKDVAQQLGKTDVATRVLLSRTIRQLEKALDDVKPTR
jgi:RNA polymerase sigma-70 factor (ECF subfamily)